MGVLRDVVVAIGMVLLLPLVILAVGAPFALVVWLLLWIAG